VVTVGDEGALNFARRLPVLSVSILPASVSRACTM
jgi:hypothetical protein